MVIKINSLDIGKIKYTFCRYYIFITVIGVLTSCVNHNIAEPPTSWNTKSQVVVKGCVDISGIYRNKGLDAPENKDNEHHSRYPQYLSDLLVNGVLVNGRKHKWVSHIEIVGPKQGVLTAFIKKQDKTIHTEVLKQGQDFTCTSDGIEIKASHATNYNIASLGGTQTKSLVFNKDNDGALLVKESDKEKGIAVLILIPVPYATSTTQYYRFPAMDNLP